MHLLMLELGAVSWDWVQGKSVTELFNTHEIALFGILELSAEFNKSFQLFYRTLWQPFQRCRKANSFKAVGPRPRLSTAVSDPTVRTREGLNSPFGKIWLSSTVKSPSLKQWGLKLQVSWGWDQGQQQLQGGVAPLPCSWCHLWTLTRAPVQDNFSSSWEPPFENML